MLIALVSSLVPSVLLSIPVFAVLLCKRFCAILVLSLSVAGVCTSSYCLSSPPNSLFLSLPVFAFLLCQRFCPILVLSLSVAGVCPSSYCLCSSTDSRFCDAALLC